MRKNILMNRCLGYNIASEPTLFTHEKHRFPLVDGATYSFFGKNMGYDDFKNPLAVLSPYFYFFTLLFCGICTFKTIKKIKHMWGKVCVSIYTIVILSFLCLTFRKDNDSLQVCSIPWKCYEGVNGTINYSLNYYISPGECYRITDLGYLYADENREENSEWSCKGSRYGCCSINVSCINAVINEWDYDLMTRPRTGLMNIGMKRDDKYGSNCPNVNDMIETKINLELYERCRLYFGACFLTCMVHLSFYLPFSEKYTKAGTDVDGDIVNP